MKNFSLTKKILEFITSYPGYTSNMGSTTFESNILLLHDTEYREYVITKVLGMQLIGITKSTRITQTCNQVCNKLY